MIQVLNCLCVCVWKREREREREREKNDNLGGALQSQHLLLSTITLLYRGWTIKGLFLKNGTFLSKISCFI